MNRVIQASNIISRRIGDEIVLIKDDGKATHVLNKTAAAIWEMCDGEHNLDEIANRMCERFDVSFEEVRGDIEEIIDRLMQAGILSQSGEPPAETEESQTI
jgi:PqqD family protein of HPr-rel-A system